MKPKTKLHHEVLLLKKGIKKLTKEQLSYVREKSFKHYIYVTQKECTCFECNHKWKNTYDKNSLLSKLSTYTCPNCGRTLHRIGTKARSKEDILHFIKIEKIKEDFQIVRIFYVSRSINSKRKANWSIIEVIQHWIRAKDGKNVVLACSSNSFGSYYYQTPRWSFGELEIRQDISKYYPKYAFILPGKKILRIIYKYGFKNTFHKIDPSDFFKMLLQKDEYFEKLLKMKQYSLLIRSLYRRDIHTEFETYWKQILIANRHNYIIDNASDWFDHLKLLEYYNYDIHNPKYICPKNFHEEHQALIERRSAEAERERQRIREEHLAAEAARKKEIAREYPKRIIGLSGRIIGSKGTCKIVELKDGGMTKQYIVHPIHLKKLK